MVNLNQQLQNTTAKQVRQCSCNCKIVVCFLTIFGLENLSVVFSRSVFVVLTNQHANRMRLILLPDVPCLLVTCFPTLLHKPLDFHKDVVKRNMNVFILSTNSAGNVSFSNKNSSISCNKYPFVFMYSRSCSCQI